MTILGSSIVTNVVGGQGSIINLKVTNLPQTLDF